MEQDKFSLRCCCCLFFYRIGTNITLDSFCHILAIISIKGFSLSFFHRHRHALTRTHSHTHLDTHTHTRTHLHICAHTLTLSFFLSFFCSQGRLQIKLTFWCTDTQVRVIATKKFTLKEEKEWKEEMENVKYVCACVCVCACACVVYSLSHTHTHTQQMQVF